MGVLSSGVLYCTILFYGAANKTTSYIGDKLHWILAANTDYLVKVSFSAACAYAQ
jgi:hypothetical protein